MRPRVPPPLPSGFATAAAPPLFDPNAGLDPDQRRALSVALSGRSLFLTGGAGVGKSFTLRRIVGALQQRHGGEDQRKNNCITSQCTGLPFRCAPCLPVTGAVMQVWN